MNSIVIVLNHELYVNEHHQTQSYIIKADI